MLGALAWRVILSCSHAVCLIAWYSDGDSRNHIWLCGGLGQWLHSAFAGVSPSSNGYSTFVISPKISTTLGPKSTEQKLDTIRGTITVHWEAYESVQNKHRTDTANASRKETLNLFVEVPTTSVATLDIPLLACQSAELAFVEEMLSSSVLWDGIGHPVVGVEDVKPLNSSSFGAGLRAVLGAGAYNFSISCTSTM
eukprot:m.68850 g.68850  ORF g.68850 m.68850 type:complete len:196 (+) comp12008_c0_seq2:2433-3020(+)